MLQSTTYNFKYPFNYRVNLVDRETHGFTNIFNVLIDKIIGKPDFSLAFIINPKKRPTSLKLTIILNRKCLYAQQYLPNQIHNTTNIKISKISNRFNNLFHLYFKKCRMGTILMLNFL